MIAYLDASVLLRHVLGQTNPLSEWDRIERGLSSSLLEVECFRTLDRMRLAGVISEVELARASEAVHRILGALELIDVSRPVVERASQPLSTPLRALDSIHLATALLWREATTDPFRFATHDHRLSLAARASGLEVIGL